MPILQSRISSSGVGGGDATAANQVLQLAQDATELTLINTNGVLSQINDLLNNNGGNLQSVFKNTNQQSVFTDELSNRESLFYKSIRNLQTGGLGNVNNILCISFTNTTAAAVANDLQTFLSVNNCFICGLTATQSIGSHDLYLLYSI
jgi:hypothetical protein